MAHNDSLSFYELIGAPLLSFVQAEFQATQTTLEFIERFGFTEDNSEGDLGKLKTFKFRQNTTNANGVSHPVDIEIPLLSMVPIPLMQVKEADLEFDLKITDCQSFSGNGKFNRDVTRQAKYTKNDNEVVNRLDFMSPNLMQMKAVMANADNRTTKQETQMKVKLRLAPSDFPTGLSHLLEIMDQGVTRTPVKNPVHSIKLFFSNNIKTGSEGYTLLLDNQFPQFTLTVIALDKQGKPVPEETEVTCLIHGANVFVNGIESEKGKVSNTGKSDRDGKVMFNIEKFNVGDQLYISCRSNDVLSKTHIVSIKK